MRAVRLTGLVLAASMGCARVPAESVELSATVGRDLEEAHRANRELALRYFSHLQLHIDEFVTNTYRPFIIRQTLDDLHLIDSLQAAARRGAAAEGCSCTDTALDALDFMEIYTEETIARIDRFRDSLSAPLKAREDTVIGAIDNTYERLTSANAIVTGHLASVRKVNDVQAELLRGVGAGDLPQQLSGGLAMFSDSLTSILDSGQEAQKMLEQGDSLHLVRALLDSLRTNFVRTLSPDSTP